MSKRIKNDILPLPEEQKIDRRNWSELPGDDWRRMMDLLVSIGVVDEDYNLTDQGERYLYSGRVAIAPMFLWSLPSPQPVILRESAEAAC